MKISTADMKKIQKSLADAERHFALKPRKAQDEIRHALSIINRIVKEINQQALFGAEGGR